MLVVFGDGADQLRGREFGLQFFYVGVLQFLGLFLHKNVPVVAGLLVHIFLFSLELRLALFLVGGEIDCLFLELPLNRG